MLHASPKRKPRLELNMKEADQIKDIVDPLLLNDDQINKVTQTMHKEMFLSMSKDPEKRKKTSLHMENTFVRSLLDGTEQGDYLALDLGGTNFRVLLCRMNQGKCLSVSRNYNVPKAKLTGPAVGVFDHLAVSIRKFLVEEKMLNSRLPLGFTFSFPMAQESIKKGILVTWTKSFACSDGVGEDAVKLLEESIAKQEGLQLDVVAILNDATGTLMAGSYLDKQSEIGLIMGTGFNVAYVEDIKNIENWDDIENDYSSQTVIDTECGAFGDNGCLDFSKTEFDTVIDEHSHHVGSFTFEKLFSGHYIGDIAHLVLLKLSSEGLLFKGNAIECKEKLSIWKTFTAEHLSNIERDTDDSFTHTKQMLADIELLSFASNEDIQIIRYLCSVLTIRAAQYVTAVLAAVLNHMQRPAMTIAIDGSLYRHHPNMHDIMMAWLAFLVPNTKTKLIDAIDGSGRGAAFVAAVAVRINKRDNQP